MNKTIKNNLSICLLLSGIVLLTACEKDKDANPSTPDQPTVPTEKPWISYGLAFEKLDSAVRYFYRYDPQGRITTIYHSYNGADTNGTRYSITYNPEGKVTVVDRYFQNMGGVSYTYSYDLKGQLSKIIRHVDLENFEFEYAYEYDQNGNCSKLTTGVAGTLPTAKTACLYSYFGDSLVVANYQIPSGTALISNRLDSVYYYPSQEDKLAYYKQRLFISYQYFKDNMDILNETAGAGEINSVFDPLFRLNKKMMKRCATYRKNISTPFRPVVIADYTYTYNANGFPTFIQASFLKYDYFNSPAQRTYTYQSAIKYIGQ